MANQIGALLSKDIQLMSRQKGTIICQIITPLLCLLFIYIVKVIVETQISKTPFGLKLSIPILFNIPIYSKLEYANQILTITSCDEWYIYDFNKSINEESKNFFKETMSKDNILKYYCRNNFAEDKLSPYFQYINDLKKNENETNNINAFLFNRLEDLNKLDYNTLINDSIKNILPDGAITINEMNNENFSYKIQINDNRLPYYHRSNGVTQFYLYNENTKNYTFYPNVLNGMLWGTDLFNKAYIKKLFPKVKLISGVQLMPIKLDDNEENIQRIINLAGSTFYPMAISLLMPLFMYSIVIEKERKLIEIMKINGLKMINYWISNFIFNYSLYTITMIIFILVGALILKLTIFIKTHWLLLFLTFISWGFCQIGLAFFFQSFITNARSATIVGYMVSLWTTLIAVSLNFSIYDLPEPYPFWLLCYPTFSLCRIFYYMTYHCGYEKCIDSLYGLSQEFVDCFYLLFFTGFIYMILGIYFYEVIPQEYGVRKHPLFFLEGILKSFQKSNDKLNYIDLKDSKKIVNNKIEEEENNDNNNEKNMNSLSIDEEIRVEYEKVSYLTNPLNMEELKLYPLVSDHLTKIYENNKNKKKGKKSLDNLTLCLNKNEIFGLLGPNGAGKTTFFSLLTGIYEPTSGNAFINGNSIRTNINKVQELIGYCPQFDLLWDDLTVREHLIFYSLIKNVPLNVLNENINKTLSNIKLDKYKNFLVKELSGGMKRRLTLGISLVGNPSIVFLDEPTTGLDPENKRQIWDILTICKENKCMILTTHLMDEAEILSDRIGIIVHGNLKCLGSQFKLKKIHGKGFKLCINLIPFSLINDNNLRNENEFIEERKDNVVKFVKEIFNGCFLVDNYKNTLIFEISNKEFDAEVLFNKIEEKKNQLYITNWAVSQVSLEDIFIRLTENEL